MAGSVDLKELFRSYQAEMEKTLCVSRTIGHAPTKGDETETCWIQWFKDYMPNRYQADKGFVVDSRGSISEQIDVIVYDQHYSPFLLNRGNYVYVPAESVYAVFEVKQTMNSGFVEYSGKKIASVRGLHRTSAPITYAAGKYEPRELFNILGGILSYEVDWSPPFDDKFREALMERQDAQRLDIGCSISKGAFEVRYKPGEEPEILAETSDTLLFFFLRFLSRLQELGTVPAIQLNAYLELVRKG